MKTLQTPAGCNHKLEVGKVINEVFGLFRINFHNQYYKAYANDEQLRTAKKLWMESLLDFPAETILAAARRALKECEFLPTIHKMLTLCAGGGLPDSRQAYREACNASSPKASYAWSHPAVYYAGRAAGWFFLASTPESVAYSVFAAHYKNICDRLLAGEKLRLPQRVQLENNPGKPLSKEENAKRLAKLRAHLEI